jgi:hypothetical protein
VIDERRVCDVSAAEHLELAARAMQAAVGPWRLEADFVDGVVRRVLVVFGPARPHGSSFGRGDLGRRFPG